MNKKLVELSLIRIDGGTQPREEIDQKTVGEYADAYASLVAMPPMVVYFDGANTWLADGFHRYHAAKKNGNQAVDVDWREGTLEMAKFYAAGANVSHGLRRKDADKKRAILMLLETEQGKRWANERGGVEKIRKHCGVSHPWVSDVLAKCRSDISPGKSRAHAQKHDLVERAISENPGASSREIERKTGVHHSTVEKVRKGRAGAAAPERANGSAPSCADRDSERLHVDDDERPGSLPRRAQAPASTGHGIDHDPDASARPRRVDGVLVPAADDPALYDRAGYSRSESRQIDENIMRELDVALPRMSEADWDRLMRRVDMKRTERRA